MGKSHILVEVEQFPFFATQFSYDIHQPPAHLTRGTIMNGNTMAPASSEVNASFTLESQFDVMQVHYLSKQYERLDVRVHPVEMDEKYTFPNAFLEIPQQAFCEDACSGTVDLTATEMTAHS